MSIRGENHRSRSLERIRPSSTLLVYLWDKVRTQDIRADHSTVKSLDYSSAQRSMLCTRSSPSRTRNSTRQTERVIIGSENHKKRGCGDFATFSSLTHSSKHSSAVEESAGRLHDRYAGYYSSGLLSMVSIF